MSLILCNVAASAVAVLYCFWKTHQVVTDRRRLVLRQRVAYLLWSAAERVPGEPRDNTWRLTPGSP